MAHKKKSHTYVDESSLLTLIKEPTSDKYIVSALLLFLFCY